MNSMAADPIFYDAASVTKRCTFFGTLRVLFRVTMCNTMGTIKYPQIHRHRKLDQQ